MNESSNWYRDALLVEAASLDPQKSVGPTPPAPVTPPIKPAPAKPTPPQPVAPRGVSPAAAAHYGNFAMNALAGHNPDDYYRQYQTDIDYIANLLRTKYGPQSGGTIYRGILLDPAEVHGGVIPAIPEITYVSFTEDKDIALAFGDMDNPMAGCVRSRYPHYQGYLIQQTYNPADMLFHHSWAKILPVHMFGADSQFVTQQKEVILKPQASYKVTPLARGISKGRIVGANSNSGLQVEAMRRSGLANFEHPDKSPVSLPVSWDYPETMPRTEAWKALKRRLQISDPRIREHPAALGWRLVGVDFNPA